MSIEKTVKGNGTKVNTTVKSSYSDPYHFPILKSTDEGFKKKGTKLFNKTLLELIKKIDVITTRVK